MIKIDIISGFLGAGKTTLIKKLLKEALDAKKVVLIENEFGEIGIDGGFLKEAGIEIREMNSGCICCSLVGDFGASLKEVIRNYHPERILIEPSGVGKLSDVMKAIADVQEETESALNSAVAVVDAQKCKMYVKNFGEFFINQISNAGTIILSRTDQMTEEKVKACVKLIREHNEKAEIITTPWDQLSGGRILEAIENKNDLEKELMAEAARQQEEEEHHHEGHGECCHHGHEDHDHGQEGHHSHHEEHEPDGHHSHESCGPEGHHSHEGCGPDGHHSHGDHGHEHHYDENGVCSCGHHHGHEVYHHADDVFGSWGMETPSSYSEEELCGILGRLGEKETYGFILRSKGMVPDKDGNEWLHFDYVPEEFEIRRGGPEVTGKICVIGPELKEEALAELFGAK